MTSIRCGKKIAAGVVLAAGAVAVSAGAAQASTDVPLPVSAAGLPGSGVLSGMDLSGASATTGQFPLGQANLLGGLPVKGLPVG